MTSNNLIAAIDKALNFIGAPKIAKVEEDAEAFYISCCGENGEGIRGAGCCWVDKDTLECRTPWIDDPCWKTNKNSVTIPDERKNVVAENWEFADYL